MKHPSLLVVLFVLSVSLAAGIGKPGQVPVDVAGPSALETIADIHLMAALGSAGAGDRIGIIVLTDGPAGPVAQAAEALGLEVAWVYDIIDGFSGTIAARALGALAALDGVVRIELDRPVAPLMNISVKDIRANYSWASGYTGDGITVAVIDTGIDTLDPAFSGRILACVAVMAGQVVPECDDTDGHGTHVAGSVASQDATYKGVAPDATLAIVRVLHAAGRGLGSDVIGGINWVANMRNSTTPVIRVATMSIGFVDPGCGGGTDSTALAADALVAKNITFTVAAGNSGHSTCTVDGASAAFKVITVGAVDDIDTNDPADDTLAGFSSGGPTTDGRLKPEIVAPGMHIRGVWLGPLYSSMDGTSMATPHVAGAAALLYEKEPTLNTTQVKSRVTSTAFAPDAAPATLPDNDWGYGLVDACAMLQLASCP